MKSIYNIIICGIISCFFLISCEEEDKRTVYPHSTPVIESASISPSSFVYGDSVTINASVSDPLTPLSTLEMKMVVNDILIAQQSIRTAGNNTTITHKFKVDYTSELPDDANVDIILRLINVEGDETQGTISNVKGNRIYYNKLYLVLEDETLYELITDTSDPNKYTSEKITIKANNIKYRIAEKLTDENKIDFTGHVWGVQDGITQIVDETGDYILTDNQSIDYITQVTFNTYYFAGELAGDNYDPNDLVLDNFTEVTANGENFLRLSRSFEKNQEINLFGELISDDIVFNMDYFERTAEDKVKFIGDAGNYDLYYSPTRKFMLVDPASREYPNILLAAGVGLGYPSKVDPEAHSAWDFNAPLQAIVFRKIANDTYQATIYFDGEEVNFKFFENSGWGNEKKSDDFTLPGIIINSQQNHDLDPSASVDGNWYGAPNAIAGNYRITINLTTQIVTAESIALP